MPVLRSYGGYLSTKQAVFLSGLTGSSSAVAVSALAPEGPHLIILNDREEAAYFYNDLVQLTTERSVCFLPSSYKRSPEYGQKDSQSVLLRTEALSELHTGKNSLFVVTYPEALVEKVISEDSLQQNRLQINKGEQLDIPFVTEVLSEYHFKRVDFVFEPGQYSVRGSIIDVYSFSDEDPYRIDFFGDEVDTIRRFNLENQLSKRSWNQITVVPNLTENQDEQALIALTDFLSGHTKVWIKDLDFILERMDEIGKRLDDVVIPEEDEEAEEMGYLKPQAICHYDDFLLGLKERSLLFFGSKNHLNSDTVIVFETSPQPVFHKNFELLEANLKEKLAGGVPVLYSI